MTMDQPGGGVPQTYSPPKLDHLAERLRQLQLAATSAGYLAQVLADGIAYRPHGLFPPADKLLQRLAATPGLRAFDKHLSGHTSSYEALPLGGWTTGDAAAQRGLDLRLFYREAAAGEGPYGSLLAAVRLGSAAAIGTGYTLNAHGGAIEAVLDEATAELAKCVFTPLVSTVEATFRITKPVPLHESLLVECRVKEQRGIRCFVEGAIKSADGATTLATCTAQLVDISHFM